MDLDEFLRLRQKTAVKVTAPKDDEDHDDDASPGVALLAADLGPPGADLPPGEELPPGIVPSTNVCTAHV